MRKISGLCSAFVIGVIVAGCGGGGGGGGGVVQPPPGCPANTFCMTSTTFSPTTRTVAAGTTVTWQNNSGVTHNVLWTDAAGRTAATAGDGTGDLGSFSSGTHTRLFTTPGTYNFYCSIHGTPTSGMRGTLVVQ